MSTGQDEVCMSCKSKHKIFRFFSQKVLFGSLKIKNRKNITEGDINWYSVSSSMDIFWMNMVELTVKFYTFLYDSCPYWWVVAILFLIHVLINFFQTPVYGYAYESKLCVLDHLPSCLLEILMYSVSRIGSYYHFKIL